MASTQPTSAVKGFFGGKCDFHTAPFYVFIVITVLGMLSTSMSRETIMTKSRLLAMQSIYTVVGATLIGMLSAKCHKGWAWVLLIPLLTIPIY
jgi:hypothetical protein